MSVFQVLTLKDQLEQEIRKRQMYLAHSARAGDELAEMREALDASLTKVARNPELDPILLEHETKKLDDLVELHSPKLSRRRSPTRALSPTRLGLSTGLPFGRSSSLQRNPVPLRSTIRK
jgi:hypothetical protein